MPGLRVGKSVAVNTLMPASLDLRTHATYRCAPRAFAVGAVQRQVPFRRSPRVTFSSHVPPQAASLRSEEHTSELQSPCNLVCRLLLEKKKNRLKQTEVH